MATVGERVDGRPTGEIVGLPCFREHKLTRVQQWLVGLDSVPDTIAGFERSFFYTDSINDLVLLEAVTDPVAVRADERLNARAKAAGWTLLDGTDL